jgi:type IV pilus assembly protein PilO
MSGDFTQKEDMLAPEPAKVFGLPMPTFLGWLFGLGGVLLAGWLLMNVVLPLKGETDTVTSEVVEGKRRLAEKDQIEAQLKQAKENLVKVEQQQQQVLSLFANEQDLKTILLDLNQLIEKNNAGVMAARQAKLANCPLEIRQQYANLARQQQLEDQVLKGPLVAEAKLTTFKPDEKGIQLITAADVAKDTYLTPPLAGQLRRETIEVAFEGNFSQAQSIFRTIERLKPLLIIKDLKVVRKNPVGGNQLDGIYAVTPGGVQFLSNCQPEVVTTTSFKMDALLPLPPTNAAAQPAAASPQPAASPAP